MSDRKGDKMSGIDIISYKLGQKSAGGGAGGGGGTVVAKTGTFTATGTSQTILHELGTVPLVVYYWQSTGATLEQNEAKFFAGVSQAVGNILGITSRYQYGMYWNAYVNTLIQTTPNYPIDSTWTDIPIRNATETSIMFGGSGYGLLQKGLPYNWVAVGVK